MKDNLRQSKMQFGERIKIFNVLFDNYSLNEAVKILTSEGGFSITINVDFLMERKRGHANNALCF